MNDSTADTSALTNSLSKITEERRQHHIYAEKGTDLERVLAAVPEELVEVRYVTFPQHDLFTAVGGNRLMVHRSAVPAIAAYQIT